MPSAHLLFVTIQYQGREGAAWLCGEGSGGPVGAGHWGEVTAVRGQQQRPSLTRGQTSHPNEKHVIKKKQKNNHTFIGGGKTQLRQLCLDLDFFNPFFCI